MRNIQKLIALFLPVALAACASTMPTTSPQAPSSASSAVPIEPQIGNPAPAGPVSVRHVKSTEPYDGGRFHLFLFSPEGDRPLDDRIRLARNTIAADPDCSWIDVPQSVIVSETAKQGKKYAESLLVAPLRCS